MKPTELNDAQRLREQLSYVLLGGDATIDEVIDAVIASLPEIPILDRDETRTYYYHHGKYDAIDEYRGLLTQAKESK